jgi:Beta-propeller repeat
MTRKQRPTRTFLSHDALEERLCLSTLPPGATLAQPDAATQAHLTATYGQLPLSFEANKGQTDPRVNFLVRGAGYSAFLTPTSAVMELEEGDGGNVVAMRLVGASPTSHHVGLDEQAGVSNYLIGNDPSKWHTNIANYAKVGYQDVYHGINLVYHGDQQQLDYDFVVTPGAVPRAIRLAFAGAQGKSIDAQGNLVLHTSGGDLVEHAPVAYQTINGVRHPITSRFVIGRDGQVGFQVGRYDHTRSLVIDPVLSLSYSTYLGGTKFDAGNAIAVDSSGNVYVTGTTESKDFPTYKPFQSRYKGSPDVFVTKFNSTGSALVYSTYLGGVYEIAKGIAVDSSGDAFVVGTNQSGDFPTTKTAFQRNPLGGGDAFLAKLNPAGSALLYSTYIGGSDDQAFGTGVAVDGSGNAYVTGYTNSFEFPTTAGAYQTALAGAQNAFVTKINPSLAGTASLVYSTYLGGNGQDRAYGIAVDTSGNAYVTGDTYDSANYPTTAGAYQPTRGGSADDNAFMTKFNATGSALVYSTFLGSSSDTYSSDAGTAIAVDGQGDAYVTGDTEYNFPTTTGALQPTSIGVNEAFVAKFDPSQAGSASLVYSTFLGGSGGDYAGGIAVDGSGNAYVTGGTGSTDFPTLNPV